MCYTIIRKRETTNRIQEREESKMTRYMVFVANTIDSSFDTIEEAESRVNEILTKHPYAVGMVHITEERI